MRRSFRVATAFTGVAAVAGGFAPAAYAATALPASRSGSIATTLCGANNGGVSTWVHLFYPNEDHPAECAGKFGFTTAKATIASLCPGNNNGSLLGSDATFADAISFHAGEGRHSDPYWTHIFSAYFRISKIYINSWSGDAKCLG